MVEAVGRLILAGALAASVLLKLANPRASRTAMQTYGFEGAGSQWLAWAVALSAEAVLAVGVAVGSDAAAYAAAGLMLLFAATLGSALMRGRAGAPCACFGAGSTVSPFAVARNLALAVGFASLPALPGG